MKEPDNSKKVSIAIGTKMYSRYADLPNTCSHALAEFVDNAIQSFRDSGHLLSTERLKVEILIEWDEETQRASKIIIKDNAAGINYHSFVKAFITAETPDDNTGLNEFGMGMNTAAGWLGKNWSVKTSALGECVERCFEFELDYVQETEAQELPFEEQPQDPDKHYTIVTIDNLTKNAPAERSLSKIKTELSSIYRHFLRNKELTLVVNDDVLSFREYPILYAAPWNKPDSAPILWKKEIDFSWKTYKATGFIAILNDMNNSMNGIVLLRRNRVIIGDDDGKRYFPKALCGQLGSPRYKRIFGEIELDGFDVSFNKNDIQDKENLEALMGVIQSLIHVPEFDLYNQAQEYRLDANRKAVSKIVKAHEKAAKQKKTKPTQFTSRTHALPLVPKPEQESMEKPSESGSYKESFVIDGNSVKLTVQFLENPGTSDIVYLDTSKKSAGEVTCIINSSHDFFRHFDMNPGVIAILKTLMIAKYAAHVNDDDTSEGLINTFNDFIQNVQTV